MAKPLLTDELWNRIKPLLPTEPPKPKGGRPRVENRACLTGILFVLKTGIPRCNISFLFRAVRQAITKVKLYAIPVDSAMRRAGEGSVAARDSPHRPSTRNLSSALGVKASHYA